MRVSVFGLGYVGAVTAACLARDGHHVVGVDSNPLKVEMVLKGQCPVVEPGITELLKEGLRLERIAATTDSMKAVRDSDVSLVSVGTPPGPDGSLRLDHVFNVCKQIGAAIKAKGKPHAVVIRSTVPPGTSEQCRAILREAAGTEVPVAFNPEFLREGSALRDYDAPAYTVIGAFDERGEHVVRELYADIDAPVHVVDVKIAELAKTLSNAWHATKVAFANEVGRIAKGLGINGHDVMDLFLQDTKLNVSSVYMRPGFAYGGSCLPKDTSALVQYGKGKGVKTPLLEAVERSNDAHIDHAVARIRASKPKVAAVLGLAFKAGTDDLRESAAVPLVKRLLGEGLKVRIYDRAVQDAKLMGTNLEFIRSELPHFEDLLADSLEAAVKGADVVAVTHPGPDFRQELQALGIKARVVDLAGIYKKAPEGWNYDGIAW